MKRALLLLTMIATSLSLTGQNLVIGDKTPELKVKSWLSATPSTNEKFVMIEFFHSSNKNSAERAAELNNLARAYGGSLVVIVVIKDQDSEARNLLITGNQSYYVAVDDGKTFTSFGAQYIPYAVISDKKGRVVWLGNPGSLKSNDVKTIIGK